MEERTSEIENQLQFLNEGFIPHFGQIQIFKFKDESQLKMMRKELVINNEEEYGMMMRSIEERLNLKNDFILDFIDFSIKPNQDGTVTFGLYYEYSDESLFDIICERIEKKDKFTNLELIEVLESLLKAVTYLQQCELVHGNLCIENIFKFGPNWKLIDNFFVE